jgi:hypothetical protein
VGDVQEVSGSETLIVPSRTELELIYFCVNSGREFDLRYRERRRSVEAARGIGDKTQ